VFGAELLTTISGLRPTSIGTIIPAPNSTEVSPGAIIEINLSDGTQQVQTNSIQLSVNGQAVSPQIDKPTGGRTTKITYDPPGNLPLESLVTVRLVFRDDATPPNVTTNEFSFTTRPEFTILFAIDDRQMWRYDRSGLDLGTAWKERIYTNETAWPEGAALLADETAAVEPIRTTISRFDNSGVTQVTTFYFRTHFNFTNNPATARLRIRHVVDDGVVVYLNGEEVHRFGLAPGLTFSNTTFFAGHENAYEGPFFISTASLVQGDNVLAAEVHQSDPTSSDIVFGLELQLVTSSPPAGLQFTSVTRSGSNILIEWTGTATLESADALSGAWTPVAGATSPYPAANTGAAKFFRLRQ
jgi:hypothetical protein